MNDLDKKIRDSLQGSKEDEAFVREPNILKEVIATFQGRHRWPNVMAFVFTFVFLAVAVWAGFRFYGTETLQEQLQWGGLCLLGLLSVGFIKVHFWMEMHTNHVLRELKRVELLLRQRIK